MIRKMNERYGFFSWFNHGMTYGISMSSKGVNEYYFRGITSTRYKDGFHDEGDYDLGSLTNKDYPAIVYTTSCTVTPFDRYESDSITMNVGESFTVGGLYGGPAFLGNTRYGWVYSSKQLMKVFVNKLEISDFHLGKAEALSKAEYSTRYHYVSLTHNLIGCPDLQMWTDTPRKIENVAITKSNNNLSVTVPGDSSVVSLNGLFSAESFHRHKIGRGTILFENIPGNYAVSVNRHNALPYIAPLYLQNEKVTGSHYIHAGTVFMGEKVTAEKPEGKLVIKNAANVIIETLGEVTLEGGFEVEKGGRFEVKK